ncbi:hypothetical protein [Duodenibacillus massiliensis]|uniref:hypothetical protein n=1 Tax=Duodenibacillus massiliensis TaxID=1852381 RepID=UPI00307A5C29
MTKKTSSTRHEKRVDPSQTALKMRNRKKKKNDVPGEMGFPGFRLTGAGRTNSKN